MTPMRPFALRRLTAAEQALARETFGGGIDPGRVWFLAVPLWNRAFVAGPGLMIWPARAAPRDFGEAPPKDQAIFVHELTHVWQAQNGVFLPWAKLRAGDSEATYAYRLTGEADFPGFNIEQQAMVVQHAFGCTRGLPSPYPAELYASCAAAWRRP